MLSATLTPTEHAEVRGSEAGELADELIAADVLVVLAEDKALHYAFMMRGVCRNPGKNRKLLRGSVDMLGRLSRMDEDSRLQIEPTFRGVDMRMRLPEGGDRFLGRTASRALRGFAPQLRYGAGWMARRGYRNIVSASVDRRGVNESGAVIRLSQGGESRIESVGAMPGEPGQTFELKSHNIKNDKQRLLGIAGGIALAYADELA